MTMTRWLWFATQLLIVLVVSVSVWPLLPWWLAPALLPLIVAATAIQGEDGPSARWAIWGGLGLDLLSPGWFGVRWLSLLIVAIAVRAFRRLVAIRDLPWLWPLWFGSSALLASLPLALLVGQWRLVVTGAIAVAVWGPISLGFLLWVSSYQRSR